LTILLTGNANASPQLEPSQSLTVCFHLLSISA
jgi:hypothetical protein